jgi:long-chain acyl-CoA synthetase
MIAALATIRAGAVVVPIDEQFSDRALAHVVADSGARLLFTTAAEAERIAGLAPGDLRVALFDAPETDERCWSRLFGGGDAPLPDIAPDDRMALFYTSGTTGTPKGVPLTQRNVAFEVAAIRDARVVREDDRALLPLPVHHVYPFVVGMLMPLALGLELILPHGLTGPEVAAAMREGRVTLVMGVPRLYAALLDGIAGRLKARGRLVAGLFGGLIDFSTWLRRTTGLRIGGVVARPVVKQIGPDLRLLVSGGAALKPEIGWRIEGLGLCLATGYGLTETAPILTMGPPCRARPGSAGMPLAGVSLRIDPEGLHADEDTVHCLAHLPAAVTVGEVQARGPNVFAGYHDLPEETAAAFTGDGWFRTGDLGYFDADGYLWLLGRASTMIVTAGGENVQPEDVEEAYGAHPAIAEVAVLAREGRLVALVVPQPGTYAGPRGAQETVRRALAEASPRLPSYQRVSDFAIAREPIPRTRLGKPRRHLLDEAYDRARQGLGHGLEPGPMPRAEMTPEDRALLDHPAAGAVWDLLAKRHPEVRLTPDSSPLLDLGIDSIEWLNLTLEIGDRTGVALDEEAIANIATVRDLMQAAATPARPGAAAAGASVLDDPEAVLKPEQRRWLEPLKPWQVRLAGLVHRLIRLWLRRTFSLTVEGLENLPPQLPYVIAPTHGSFLDPFALIAALDRDLLARLQWAGWTGIAFRNRLFRAGARLAQAVPVDPDRAVLSSVAFAAAVLKRGRGLIWFPEGSRSTDGRLQRFMPGIGVLLDRFRVPVVPVVIEGAHEAWPPRARLPHRHPVRVRILPALDPARLAQQGSGGTDAERIVAGRQASVEAALSLAARPSGRPPAPPASEAAPPQTARR